MKRWKKALVSLLTGCLVCGMMPVDTDAAAPQPAGQTGYEYTITLSAGNKGQVKDGREKIVVSGLNYGNNTRVIFSNDYLEDNIEVADSRYYIKGVRLSGRDTGETADLNPVVTVNGDADYVVAYGVVGDQVAYTVQYQDADGNELAPSRTFYGNIGDKPIVAYQYIDGYVPQSLALTKTLSSNAAENIFTFVYTPGDPGEIVNTVTDTTTVTGDPTIVTVVVPGAGTAGGGAGGGAGAGAGGGAAEGGAAEGGETETIEEDQTPQGTQDIVDLDEEETPQGTMDIEDVEEEETAKGLPLAFSVGIGAVAAVVLICLVVWLLKGRKSGSDGTTGE